MKDEHRQLGVIENVTYGKDDLGILTLWLLIDFQDGGHQGFGGIALGNTKSDPISRSYHYDLCRVLNIAKIEDAVGKKVYALRCWGRWNESIEGIESVDTWAQFVHWRWRRKATGKGLTPIQSRQESLRISIKSMRENITRMEDQLIDLPHGYTSW